MGQANGKYILTGVFTFEGLRRFIPAGSTDGSSLQKAVKDGVGETALAPPSSSHGPEG